MLGDDVEARRVLGRAWLRNARPDLALSELLPGPDPQWPEDVDTLADLAVAAGATHADATAISAYLRALSVGDHDAEHNRILNLEYAVVLTRGSSREQQDAIHLLRRLLDQPMDPALRAWAEGALGLALALRSDSAAPALTPGRGQPLLYRVATDARWAEQLRAEVVGTDFGPRLPLSERLAILAILADAGERPWAGDLWAAVSAPPGSDLSELAERRLAEHQRSCRRSSRCR